jgi:stage V sporulation protein SpoVS
MEEIIFRVSNDTNSKDLGGSISRELSNNKTVKIKSIGKIALNNAVKGIIIARSYLLSSGNKDMSIKPYFETKINSEEFDGELTLIVHELNLLGGN